jgi:endonuclease/exonuclease/phosphatase family metal-dependent hydrolase
VVSLTRRTIVTVTFVAGLGLFVLLLSVRLARPVAWWPLEALDTLALYGFAPFLLVAVVALLARSRSLGLLLLAALLFFAEQFGAPLLSEVGLTSPPVVTAGDDRPRVRIMTLNLHAPNESPIPFADLVRAADPDVVVFQEVTSPFVDDFNRLLGDVYVFSATAGNGPNQRGSGTWSRLPLGERQALQLGLRGNVMHRVQLLLPSGPVWLYNVHLANPTGESREDGKLAMLKRWDSTFRDAELAWLIEQTDSLDAPYILAGDFNSAAGSAPYRVLPPSWRDAYALVGRGLGNTYPSPAHEDPHDPLRLLMPMIRIDYVLTSPGLQPIQAWTLSLADSDHLAVVAEIEPR